MTRRARVAQGQLSYPYSTRELVNLIRHLQHYPKDSLLQILENVFSFDIFNPQLREHLAQTFHRYQTLISVSACGRVNA